MTETMRIVVPSRKRVKNMKTVLSLLPDALICVAEEERQGYLQVVPRDQLITHPNLPGLAYIRNWLNRTIQEDCLVMFDDDLRSMWCIIGKYRKQYKDPAVIREVIDNTHTVARDLNINVFTWSRSATGIGLAIDAEPIKFAVPLGAALGLRGDARFRQFDVEIPGRADVDFALKTIMDDRIMYGDIRFYFDFGRCFAGAGGNAGLITDEQFAKSTKILIDRWGQYVCFSAGKRKRSGEAYKIRVPRKNPLVIT